MSQPHLPHPGASGPNLPGPSEAERSLVCDQLAACFATGRLTREDFDRRTLLALQATTRSELAPALYGLGIQPPSTTIVVRPGPGYAEVLGNVVVTVVVCVALFCLLGLLWVTGTNSVVGLLGAIGGATVAGGTTHLVHVAERRRHG